MVEEYDAQIKNKIWGLVPRPLGANVINFMWFYKHKCDAGGAIRRNNQDLWLMEKHRKKALTLMKPSAQ